MLTPDEYNVGDRVRVVIEGEITYVGGSGVLPGIAVLAGEWGTAIPLGVPGVTVERLAPPEPEGWPGELGALWMMPNGGQLYRVHRNGGQWLEDDHGGLHRPEDIMASDQRAAILLYDPTTAPVEQAEDGTWVSAPAEPLHTWPPDRPGLWYRENGKRRDRWYSVAVTSPGVVAVGLRCTGLNGVYTPAEAEAAVGRMSPIPALSGQWPGLGGGLC